MKKSLLALIFFLTTSMFLPFGCSKTEHPLKGKENFSREISIRGRKVTYKINSNLKESLYIWDGENRMCINNNDEKKDVDEILIYEFKGNEIGANIQIRSKGLQYNEKAFPNREIVEEIVNYSNAFLQEARKILKEDIAKYQRITIDENPLK